MEKYGLYGYSRIVYCKEKDLMTHQFRSSDSSTTGTYRNDYLLVSILGPIIGLMVIASFSNYLRADYRTHSKRTYIKTRVIVSQSH